jgi:hypothetical protein
MRSVGAIVHRDAAPAAGWIALIDAAQALYRSCTLDSVHADFSDGQRWGVCGWLRWTFVAVVTTWTAIALAKGLIRRAGPAGASPARNGLSVVTDALSIWRVTVSAALNAGGRNDDRRETAWISLRSGVGHQRVSLFNFSVTTRCFDGALKLITEIHAQNPVEKLMGALACGTLMLRFALPPHGFETLHLRSDPAIRVVLLVQRRAGCCALGRARSGSICIPCSG